MTEYIVDFGDTSSAFVGLAMAEAIAHGAELHEEIVRCSDCKHLDEIRVSYSAEPVFQCMADWCQGVEGDSPFVEPDGFCAWGERLVS